MLSVRIYPLFSPNEPLQWDVHTFVDARLVLIEKLPTAKAQRRLDQARVERARAEMRVA